MTRVIVSGAGGKLAAPIIAGIAGSDDLELAGLYNPNRAGEVMNGVDVSGDAAALQADVVVETVHPDHVFENLEVWKQSGMAAIVGTSGFTEERLQRLEALWGEAGPPCLVVPNFSVGAVLMMEFARTASRYFEAVEIIERHHSTKPDAPSGTALATAMSISGSGGESSKGSEELVPGARGADVAGVRVHALRLPGLISQQEVAMSNVGEVLSIEHLSTSYESFANGALLAVRKVRDLDPGVHLGLAALLE
ncbi:MAG: 4-hydroxy-tetrahydrodipicolinate reductase [Actinobacteria bacterium]|nr:MAG: 4-hydroxy-tetrahydrodipicolinate reductase [Actinomycetota bacterium]